MALIFLHRFFLLLLSGFWLTIFSSCGNDQSLTSFTPDPLQEAQTIEGRYEASLLPLNSAVAGNLRGKILIQVMADTISVSLKLHDGMTQVFHPQYVYTGNVCPNEKSDLNRDGYIDLLESGSFLGSTLIPLDGDLNSAQAGVDGFPQSDHLGRTSYYQEGSLSSLLQDLLITPDSGRSLRLEGKVIAIHGLRPEIYLPGTVGSIPGIPQYQSMPIACGILERVKLDETQTTDQDGEHEIFLTKNLTL